VKKSREKDWKELEGPVCYWFRDKQQRGGQLATAVLNASERDGFRDSKRSSVRKMPIAFKTQRRSVNANRTSLKTYPGSCDVRLPDKMEACIGTVLVH
jgi:hypothetical protein